MSEMDDVIAAGDGTLHGAIDYWQERALKAEAELAKPAAVPDELTDKQVVSACFSYRHDYGLLDDKAKGHLEFQCREWWRALRKELECPSKHPMVLAAAPQPPAQVRKDNQGSGEPGRLHHADTVVLLTAEMADIYGPSPTVQPFAAAMQAIADGRAVVVPAPAVDVEAVQWVSSELYAHLNEGEPALASRCGVYADTLARAIGDQP